MGPEQLTDDQWQALKEVADAYQNDSLSRRDALKLAGAGGIGALLGGGGAMSAVDRASAGTAQAGQLGTVGDPLDFVIEDLKDEQGNIVASANAGALEGTDLRYDAVTTGEGVINSPGTKIIDTSDYSSLQAAFNAVPQLYAEKVIIDIPNGTYTEADIQVHGVQAHGPLSEIEIRGDPLTPSNVTIDAQNNGFGLDIQYCNITVTLNGLTVTNGNWADVLVKHVSRVNLKNVTLKNAGGDDHAGAFTAVNCLVNFGTDVRATSNTNAGLFLDNCFVWNEGNRDMGPAVSNIEVDNNSIHGIAIIGGVFYLEGSDQTNKNDIEIHSNDFEGLYCSRGGIAEVRYATIGGNGNEGMKAIHHGAVRARDAKLGAYGANGGVADIFATKGGYAATKSVTDLSLASDPGSHQHPTLDGSSAKITASTSLANTAIGSNTRATVQFDTTETETPGYLNADPPNNRIVVKETGVVEITARIEWADEADYNAGENFDLELNVNGTTVDSIPKTFDGQSSPGGFEVSAVVPITSIDSEVTLDVVNYDTNTHEIVYESDVVKIEVTGIE